MKPLSKHRSRYRMPGDALLKYLVYHSNVYDADIHFTIPQNVNWGNSNARFEVLDAIKCDSTCKYEGLAFTYGKTLKYDIESMLAHNERMKQRKEIDMRGGGK